jgi:hypothetical protein
MIRDILKKLTVCIRMTLTLHEGSNINQFLENFHPTHENEKNIKK